MATERTVPKQLTPFKPGESGNPKGRPKGSRNKLGEAFLSDMLDDWQANGVEAIKSVREDKPDAYLKVVASILPKELNLKVNEFDGLTDSELARELASIASQLANEGYDLSEGIAAPTGNGASKGKPPQVH